MAAWFAANALWWGYRAGATISRVMLDHFAAQRGMTLEEGFANARLKAQFGQISGDELNLVRFVEFNDKWRWTSAKDFALDTSAMATAGLGLLAKVGLGNRVLAVLGVKSAPTAGVLIDGIIDAVGALLTGGKAGVPGVGDILQGALEVLTGVQQTAAVKHGTNVVNATVKLGNLIGPFLGKPLTAPGLLTTGGAIIGAGAQLLASIVGLWGAVEEHLPERPLLRPAEPGRNLMRELRDAGAPRATGPSEFWLTPPADPVDIILPGPGRRGGGGLPPILPDIPPFFRDPPPDPDPDARRDFVRMFSNSFGGMGGSLRALKDQKAGRTFPFG